MNVIGLPEGWKMAREIDLLHERQTFLRVNKLCAGLTVGVLALLASGLALCCAKMLNRRKGLS